MSQKSKSGVHRRRYCVCWLLLALAFAPLVTDPLSTHGAEPASVSTKEVPPDADRTSVALGNLPSATAVLRDGTRHQGTLLANWVLLTTPYGNLELPLTDLKSLRFAQTLQESDLAETVRGDRISGVLGPGQLEFRATSGAVSTLQKDRLLSLSFVPVSSIQQPSNPNASESIAFSETPPAVLKQLQRLTNLVWIPVGRFTMGSPEEELGRDFDEGPKTEVTLTKGFWMARCEVTQAEFKSVTGENPSSFVGDPQRPVEKVNWREAVSYCERLTKQDVDRGAIPSGYAYRLPTEAEWEYACRAGSSTRFFFGDDDGYRRLGDYAWYGDNSDSSTQPVGRKLANPWGLHDLCGNVLEWCQDTALSSLPGGHVKDPSNPTGSTLRIARGGSWLYGAKACRSANRDSYGELTRCSDLGFRVVLSPTAE